MGITIQEHVLVIVKTSILMQKFRQPIESAWQGVFKSLYLAMQIALQRFVVLQLTVSRTIMEKMTPNYVLNFVHQALLHMILLRTRSVLMFVQPLSLVMILQRREYVLLSVLLFQKDMPILLPDSVC